MTTDGPTPPASVDKRDRANSLLKSGVGLTLIKGINTLLGFATVTVFARLLPPADFGLYILCLTTAQFVSLPLQMGLPVLVMREIAVARSKDNPGAVNGVLAWSQRIMIIGTLIAGTFVIGVYGVVVAAGWPILQQFSWPLVLLIAALAPVLAEMKRVMGVLNGFRLAAISRLPDAIIRPALLLLAGGLGLWLGLFAEVGLLVSHLGAALVAAAFGWLVIAITSDRPTRRNHPAEFNSVSWRASLWPLTIVAAATTVMNYVDVLMLGMFDTVESVAFYRVASQLAAAALLVQVAINAVFSPRMAAFHSRGETERMQAMAVTGSRIAFGATLVFALALVLVGRNGFVYLLGEEYGPIYGLTVLLSAGAAVNAFFGGTGMLLNMTNRERYMSQYATWATVGNIAMNLALIPLLGPLGAAISTILTTFGMQVMSWNRVLRSIGVRSDAFGRIVR
ncbi:lipopolysaccharide biosynthesis protein [Palleronia abyssalis]|mgnify:CR=1 FL=1|uniref:Uncharacterized protein n=1 Tax=Palleronia abyssalis TaxID=1501240 RepID=A0A2R8BSS9_9RHOB|nr:oligosaccharide flippase family protein [Palleronia abyssalis]SPJ23212.1 hypothetical protein PAA8504_01018 [Palleronia abyssalis]